MRFRTLLVDLLQEFNVLSERLIVVLDGDASEELIVELVQQVDEIRPGLVTVQSVFVQVGELLLERLVQQLLVLSEGANLALEVLYLALVVVDDARCVLDSLLELAKFVLSALVAHFRHRLAVRHVVDASAQVEQRLLVLLLDLASAFAPM